MSVERGVGAGVGVYLLFKECCFRVRVRVRVDTNPIPHITLILTFKRYSIKKEIDPDPDRDHAFYFRFGWQFRGGSKEGARASPLFLDQTETRKVEKKHF